MIKCDISSPDFSLAVTHFQLTKHLDPRAYSTKGKFVFSQIIELELGSVAAQDIYQVPIPDLCPVRIQTKSKFQLKTNRMSFNVPNVFVCCFPKDHNITNTIHIDIAISNSCNKKKSCSMLENFVQTMHGDNEIWGISLWMLYFTCYFPAI
ncbi:hypothetical protein Cni_G08680 [Canna indica]|uniref:Uncharacterized protein n=1 Tax=Canna indica TaxID=4628 RepID=A0AAQ3Q711_9LILI|nr:hypothetical protein Cni_G08680 [Canna indica]